MRFYTTNLSHISKEKTLRSDFVYQALAVERVIYNEEYYAFNELFDVIEEKIAYTGIVGSFRYCQTAGFSNIG